MLILIRPTEPFVLILNVLLPAVYVAPKASNVGEMVVFVFEKRTITLVIGPRFVNSNEVSASARTVATFSPAGIIVLGKP